MASVSAPPFPPPSTHSHSRNLPLRSPNFFCSHSPLLKKPSPFSSSRVSESSTIYRCLSSSSSSSPSPPEDEFNKRWDSQFQGVVKNAIKRLEDYMNSVWKPVKKNSENVDLVVQEKKKEEVGVEDWDWERWKKHFDEVEEQERIVSVLKSQLSDIVRREVYNEAAKIKVAIAAAATNDTVGRVITQINRAIEEERYQDAAFLRDYAGAGLVGWWAGITKDSDDPYGRIIRISAEHGRYVARSFSPRHLATATPGVPLFEIFITMSAKGKYKQQAVYLKRNGIKSGDIAKSSKPLDKSKGINPLSESTKGPSELSALSSEDVEDSEERDDDSDTADGLAGFQNILQDMIPDVKVTVMKVTSPEKVDKDFISKVIENIIEEEEEQEEEKDLELESVDTDDTAKAGNQDQDDIKIDDGGGNGDNGEVRSPMTVKVVIDGRLKKLSSTAPADTLLRVPARLEKKGRLSFAFSIEKEDKPQAAKGKRSRKRKSKLQGQRSMNHVMSDLAKFVVNREKIPMKVLKDVEELINLTLGQSKNRQPLSGTTIFNRIEIPASSDLLNGLYIGAHSMYTSEVIHLKRKFGQWQEDGVTDKQQNLEFYEYVEATKLTGDPYVPAGQVAFRAKVGKQYQLPHKGIIPEEFGVVARYRGQGRLADHGFQNPRWVDGELVILDGKDVNYSTICDKVLKTMKITPHPPDANQSRVIVGHSYIR